jgi:hypothetical protein
MINCSVQTGASYLRGILNFILRLWWYFVLTGGSIMLSCGISLTKENLIATEGPCYYLNVDAEACKVPLLEGFKRLTSALDEAERTTSCYIYGERVPPPIHSWFGYDGQ